MPTLTRGSIVWVELPDPQGRNPKVRPAVVITDTDKILPDGEVRLVAITGETGAAPADECVPIPWLATGHPKTGLKKPSVAVVSWTARKPVAEITTIRGHVPSGRFIELLKKLTDFESPAPPPPPPAAPPSPPPP